MKLKLTLQRPGRDAVDLLATIDATTTVGELAGYVTRADLVARADAAHDPETATLSVLTSAGPLALDSRLAVSDSGLRSGAAVSVSRSSSAYIDPYRNAAAVVRVLSGPDIGKEFPVAHGATLIGREAECEVKLTDQMVSRRHARLNVTEYVEVIDLGSANGVQLGAASVERAVLQPADVVRLGDTELSVRRVQAPRAGEADETRIEFVRSPRLDPHFGGTEFEAPQPPERPTFQRFPRIPMFAPILLGAVLYLVTKNLTSIVFVALSPLLMVGNIVETRIAGRQSFQRALQQWRADVADLVQELTAAVALEGHGRRHEHPATAECVEAVRNTTPLLWTRRPGDPGFAELRLGLGRLPSRSTIDLRNTAQKSIPRELTKELVRAVEPFKEVDAVPVVAKLSEGALGVAGPRVTALPVARAYVLQAVSLHSPAELIVAGFASSQSGQDWTWLKWLPHTTSPHSPLSDHHLASTSTECTALVSRLEELIDRRTGEHAEAPLPAVLVIVEDDAPLERSRLVSVAEHGPAVGVHVLWHAPDVAWLPAACRTYAEITRQVEDGRAGYVHMGSAVSPINLETVNTETAAEVGRRLAPLVDSGARVADDSDLPRTVSQLSLIGPELASSPGALIERWGQSYSIVTGGYAATKPSPKPIGLRAVIGSSATGRHVLDLRTQGPHALVGGTTGAGKSELLQVWILGLATAYSPQRLTFLLVDYKGGAAFSECGELPHTVGMVTDLSPHLVNRAITSLKAEIHHREKILNEHDAKDLITLERKAPQVAPPSLVIVVDEFAALAKEVPEFVEGVVDVAQRGRSLGLHLILATQRPAGVIKDNLRANTNLRLALRMADESDSTDVLGSPQAASFDPLLAGRAVSKTGAVRLVPFQTAYAGGWTTEEKAPPEILLEELTFGAGAVWEPPIADEPPPRDAEQTDIKRVVRNVRAANELAQLPAPRIPWLPELQATYDLSDRENVPSPRADTELVFGVGDDPRNQSQPVVSFEPDQDGNLAVYGTGGSGKSALLRTLAIASGSTIHGGPCHVYGLDFGSRGLAPLEELPHVGSIIYGGDHERVVRLITWLRALIDERAMRYSKVNAGSITEFRRQPGAADEPRILLLVDGIAAFRSAYESTDRVKYFEMFSSLAADGRPVGVHVILSSDQRGGMSTSLASSVQARVVLRLVAAEDYGYLGVPADVLSSTSPPGRGIFRDAEIQVALLGGKSDIASQAAAIKAFAESMRRNTKIPPPQRIQSLPERLSVTALPRAEAGLPVIGLASNTLGPFAIEPKGTFVISGPPGSGRSTALTTIVRALRRADPLIALHYLGNRRSPLADLGCWESKAFGADEVNAAAARLTRELGELPPTSAVSMAVIIENASEFSGSPADMAMQEMIRAAIAHDQFVVTEGETSTIQRDVGFIGAAKSSRTGLAFSPDQGDGTPIFRTNFPRINRAEFPPGRALYVTLGRTQVVHIAIDSGDTESAVPSILQEATP